MSLNKKMQVWNCKKRYAYTPLIPTHMIIPVICNTPHPHIMQTFVNSFPMLRKWMPLFAGFKTLKRKEYIHAAA
jgi:hypothetical protein